MSKKLTQEEFLAKAVAVHGVGRYDYSQVLYVNSSTKVAIICPKHGLYEQTAAGHMGGKGCQKCGVLSTAAAKYKTTELFISRAQRAHGLKYDYSKVVYQSDRALVTIICPTHGEFQQSPNKHGSGRGCYECGLATRNKPRIDAAASQFIERARAIHGSKYDYSKVLYKNNRAPVTIICPIHGEFQKLAGGHIASNRPQGCKQCAWLKVAANSVKGLGGFIKDACIVHGDKYDYSTVEYKNDKTPVTIICQLHGAFIQSPNAHLVGQGCVPCGRDRQRAAAVKDFNWFLSRARAVHGDKYNYSKVDYYNVMTKVVIICLDHGEFEQIPNSHFKLAHGCPRCGREATQKAIDRGWVELANGRQCTLYFIRLFTNEESFYKIGITIHSVEVRYSTSARLGGYQYEVIALHRSFNARAVREWEQSILETFTHLKYRPNDAFDGDSECFSSCEEILAIFPL